MNELRDDLPVRVPKQETEDKLRGDLLKACAVYVTRGEDDKLRSAAVAVVEAWARR